MRAFVSRSPVAPLAATLLLSATTCAAVLATAQSAAQPPARYCPNPKRSAAVIAAFKKKYPCPFAAGDCVADHVDELCACGLDGPARDTIVDGTQVRAFQNLRWQTKAAAALKDAGEKRACAVLAKQAKASGVTP